MTRSAPGRCGTCGMFDMTNDSHLFRTAAQLDDDGFYPVARQPVEEGR